MKLRDLAKVVCPDCRSPMQWLFTGAGYRAFHCVSAYNVDAIEVCRNNVDQLQKLVDERWNIARARP